MDTREHDPHRPTKLSDMAGTDTWLKLQTLITRADPPNIILTGGPGIGKSCAARLGVPSESMTLWLRCSADPSLRRDNRDRIKNAARKRVVEGRTNWIVLEHADVLHADAQAFLRRIIETSTGSCRFILEVRDLSAIAEPLLSRTVLFNGPTLLPYEIRGELLHRVPTLDPSVADRIAQQSGGNIRWAILQALGGGDSMMDPTINMQPKTWKDLLTTLEEIQRTGSYPRMCLRDHDNSVWDRPGGACPWSLSAMELLKSLDVV